MQSKLEKVGVVRCSDYKYESVEKAVFQCLDSLQGLKEKIKPGSKALVKVNLLKKNNPEDAVTTHPAVAEAIVRYLQALGCEVTLGDSPGGPYTEWMLKGIYKATGMVQVAERTNCKLNYDVSVAEVHNEQGRMLKRMQVIKVAEDADFIVSVAKLKTHAMMTYTGAVKNLFGIIPGIIKADYHLKMNDVSNFAAHLVDICEYAKPVFSVIDGIDGMEGDGPSAGDKRHVGIIMASENPYALDFSALRLIGINPSIVPTMKEAMNRGLFSCEDGDIEYTCLKPSDINIKPFKLPRSLEINFIGGRIPAVVEKWVMNNLRPRPVFDHETCISCRICEKSCPPKVINMDTGKPVVNLSKCIRCFCCHELCPQKAVHIKKHGIYDRLFR